jgi:hypothetical protein
MNVPRPIRVATVSTMLATAAPVTMHAKPAIAQETAVVVKKAEKTAEQMSSKASYAKDYCYYNPLATGLIVVLVGLAGVIVGRSVKRETALVKNLLKLNNQQSIMKDEFAEAVKKLKP